MNKMIVVFTLLLMTGFAAMPACIIAITPESSQSRTGDVVPVTIDLKYEHRRCVLALSDTQMKAAGLEIVEKGDWQTLGTGHYSLKLKVRLVSAKASLTVFRECDKKGISEETYVFKVR